MATLQEVAEQIKQYGNVTPSKKTGGNSQWEKMLTMLAMAQKANPQTMAGFALGNLLRQGFDNWKERYDARGEWKNALQSMDESKRNQWLDELKANNPQRYEHLQNKYRDFFSQMPTQGLLGEGGKLAQRPSFEEFPLALGNPFDELQRR